MGEADSTARIWGDDWAAIERTLGGDLKNGGGATNERLVAMLKFETTHPAFRGEMTITTTLADAHDGTDVLIAYERISRSVSTADNEAGTRMSLANLAALVEAGSRQAHHLSLPV